VTADQASTTITSVGSIRRPKGFYVYAYLRQDGSPYYIGKGVGGRAWAPHDHGRVRKVPDLTQVVILCENLSNEDSLEHEQAWIARYGTRYDGTGVLHNMTKGGDGLDPEWARSVKSREWSWKRNYDELQRFCADLDIRLPDGKTMVPAPWLEKPYGRKKLFAMPAWAHWGCLYAEEGESLELASLRLEVLKAIYLRKAQGQRLPFKAGFQLQAAEWSEAESYELLASLQAT